MDGTRPVVFRLSIEPLHYALKYASKMRGLFGLYSSNVKGQI